jgi:hypothetical protein
MRQPLTVEKLKEHVQYDRETGVFTRVKTHPKRKYVAGSVTGVARPDGYLQVMIDGKLYLAHRLAWLYEHGNLPSGYIDHINGVKSDNRICNLRDVSQTVNLQNIRQARPNRKSSKFLGVSYANKGQNPEKPYRARIVVDGKELHLGTFADEYEAHIAYLAAKRVYHEGCML